MAKIFSEDLIHRPVIEKKWRAEKKKLLKRPTKALQPAKGMKVSALVEAMKDMSIQARNIGRCAEVLDGIYSDKKRPTVLLGLAGPLIAAGLRNTVLALIENGFVDVVVSTGAILFQDVYQARGFRHYKGSPAADDSQLREMYVDRIYDTYVDEEAFLRVDGWFAQQASAMEPGVYSSRQYLAHIGSVLTDESSIVRACYRRGVPIFSPALNDSSIGIGLTAHHHRCRLENKPGIMINSIQDNYELTQIVVKSKSTAALYIAGGVPKNYINDSIIMSYIFNKEQGHDYALQVTTAVTADGGLSSSTLDEAQSWGKIDARARFAMAWVEPSVALPLLVQYTLDQHPSRPALKMSWQGDVLKKLEVPGKPRKK